MNYQHRVEYKYDNEPVQFRWHFPRGTLDPRMSAMELAIFLMPHMPSVLPLLSDDPLVYTHFQALLNRFVNWNINELDEVMSWVKPVVRTADYDYIDMDLNAVKTNLKCKKATVYCS